MNKPSDVSELLVELRDEIINTSVTTIKGSYAEVYPENAKDSFRLTSAECELALHDPGTIQRLFEALGAPVAARIELHHLVLDPEAEGELENCFTSVEEV